MTARSGRRSVTIWAAACVVLVVVVAVTGFGGSVPALAFKQAGHWVYNSTVGAVFHVDGGSRSVDSKMALPGLSPANQVVQDDQHGYVVDRRNGRVLVFGKSSLSVDSTMSVGTDEEPVSLEVNGGPYLVYEHGGRIIRLGQPPATINAGGNLQTPIATSDGTVWVQRPGTHSLCRLPTKGTTLTCPVQLPTGHQGALTILDDHPAFVDLTASTIATVGSGGLGKAQPLGVSLPADAQVSASDAGGRLPILTADHDREPPELLLIDTSTVGLGKPAAAPITVPLGQGSFDTPMTSGGAITVVNRTGGKILTYTNQGSRKASLALPHSAGTVALSRGEDGRVYIDNATGTETYIVDGDGTITPVDIGAKSGPPSGTPTTVPTGPATTSPTAAPSKAPVPTATPTRPTATTTTPAPGKGPTVTPTKPTATLTPRPTTPVPSTQPPIELPTLAPSSVAPPTQPTPTQAPPTTTPPPPPPTVPPRPPAAPSGVTATPGDAQAAVSWSAAADNGSAITGYLVSWRATGGGGHGSVTVGATSRHATATGLSNGTGYVVSVAARNVAGAGPATESASFIPDPVLSAPTGVTAKAGSDGTVTVQWQEAATQTTHGAVSFRVTTSGGRALSTAKTQIAFTGLTPGSSYQFTVAAIDGSGQRRSTTSAAVIPYSAPGQPSGLKATTGSKQVALSWAAPATNGSKIVNYTVAVAGGATQTVTQTSATITGLTSGTKYTFTVRANGEDPNGSGTQVTGAAATVTTEPVTAQHVPYLTIDDATINSSNQLILTVDVDAGGDPGTTCKVTFLGVVVSNKVCAHGRDTITVDGVDSKGNSNVPVTVTGINSAGAGPTESTTVSSPGGAHANGARDIPPARVQVQPTVGGGQ